LKIAVADNCSRKFCNNLIEYWISKGHEVKYESGASEFLAQWADIYYVEWADHNIHYLYGLYHDDPGNNRTPDWDNNKKPIIVCRAIDWDIWTGGMNDQNLIDWVDKWICIAPHIEKKLRSEHTFREGQLQLIRPGVNLEKFTLKTMETDGFQLGMVLGDMWWPKNHMGGLDIFTTLYQHDNRWRLHIRGQHEGGEYWKQMYDHYLESRGIKDVVTLYPYVDNMNNWLEQIDVLLHPGMKETFCYAMAETMAKGIPIVFNNFYGSEDIWSNFDRYRYNTHSDAVLTINELKKEIVSRSKYWRQYIEQNYSLERMLKEYDQYLGL